MYSDLIKLDTKIAKDSEPAKIKTTKIKKGNIHRMKTKLYIRSKTQIVIELPRGEKQLNQISNEYELAPNQIRNRKSEALEKLLMVFVTKRDNKLKELISKLGEEKDEAYDKSKE